MQIGLFISINVMSIKQMFVYKLDLVYNTNGTTWGKIFQALQIPRIRETLETEVNF
jgi:hypothetical protein